MLVVRVEVWPARDAAKVFEIARLGVVNDSGVAEFSDYTVTALLHREATESVHGAKVHDHRRSHGWMPLVRRSVSAISCESGRLPYDDPIAEILRRNGHG